jgi:hypothetical protein
VRVCRRVGAGAGGRGGGGGLYIHGVAARNPFSTPAGHCQVLHKFGKVMILAAWHHPCRSCGLLTAASQPDISGSQSLQPE